MLKVLSCVTQEHNLQLVGLSAAICAMGCFTALTLLARSWAVGASWRWLVLAAAIFGGSVWSLHFVAMLAFMPTHDMAYDLATTMVSALVAAGGALIAFLVLGSHGPRRARILPAAAALACAISGMHYLGVAAMRFSGFIIADPAEIAWSVLIALAFSTIAMTRSSELLSVGRRMEVTLWLSLAICGMHFTGMAAIMLSPGEAERTGATLIGTADLAVAVGAFTITVLITSLVALQIEQHLSQRVLRDLARMRMLNNLAHEVLLIHRDGIILEINSAGERLFKTSASALVGRPVLELFARDSVPAVLRRSRCSPENLQPEEIEIQPADGTILPALISCQPIDYLGKPATAVALRDLSEQKRGEARIRHLARHDSLTNLPNRYDLLERLGILLEATALEASDIALAYLDLDRFKPVNDLHGHAIGDALLVEVAKRILAEIQPFDTLARIGGDEFVIVMMGGGHPGRAADLGGRIVDSLAQPFQIEGHRVEIGVSMGIALYPGDARDAAELLRAADTAMYRAKEGGRGSLRFFEASMNAQLQARRLLEQELRGAVERNELVLHYQPLVNGATGEVETFEALIRWRHERRGLVPPMEFIPLAEASGLIAEIGRWVIDEACRAAASWPHRWRVSVNVSPAQFRQSDICAIVAAALAKNALHPSRLVVEITEGVLIADAPHAVDVLRRLRAQGIRLALDDFGTGFSSLSYLMLFKFDKLKIDKSFVTTLGTNEDALTITRTIVNLGHNLGLQVTAEGVETIEQLAILQKLDCDQIQGYLVARPAAVEAFSEFDRARTRALFATEKKRLSA